MEKARVMYELVQLTPDTAQTPEQVVERERERARARVCVCVCERERERERERESERARRIQVFFSVTE
jgi:hypothetical protein